MNWLLNAIVIIGWEILSADAQFRVDRICTTGRFENECSQLQRGNSDVNCQLVQDSIECAQRIRNGTAEFGIFSAESGLLLAALQWDGLTVVKELRHRDRLQHEVDFESVVVVQADHQRGVDGIKGLNYCHPGLYYDRTERWSERFLKHFERTVFTPECDKNIVSPAEIETAALAKIFNQACRPGAWSNDIEEDTQLKTKYPQLCELCSSLNNNCEYNIDDDIDTSLPLSHHIQALKCLMDKGQIAYVSRQEVQTFFSPPSIYVDQIDKYAYLCPNGSLQTISNNEKPCVWLSQPWPLIISSNERAVELSTRIMNWIRSFGSSNWETAIKEILTANSYVPVDTTIQKPRDFLRPYREVPFASSLCSSQSSWCTTSIEEKEKCDLTRVAGITTGIYPLIECRDPVANTVACLNDISNGRADFTGIDSNYGFIARYPYNLTTALYAETETKKYASVVVVIRANSTFERFENLRNAKACFGEFGSIASIAFINTGKHRGFFNRNQCRYSVLLSDFFGPSCAPGALDIAHAPQGTLNNLCELCRPTEFLSSVPAVSAIESQIDHTSPPLIHKVNSLSIEMNVEAEAHRLTRKGLNCNADATNSFYGNRGALKCLQEEGDVAILEQQYLNEHSKALKIDPNDYRIICRNGSLADRTGFDVEEDCALTTIVDGEIVVARNNRKTAGIINALSSFDKYFQNDPDFKMYNSFAGHRDLLFKDSTLGLVSRNEENLGKNVENYKKLFQNLEACVQSHASKIIAGTTIGSIVLTIVVISISKLLLTNL